MFHYRFVNHYLNLVLSFFMLIIISTCHADYCPLFKCSPEIVSLSHNSLNSTFDIICEFYKKIENPSDILWKFNIGPHQRIITDMDGGVLAPFKHVLINDGISESNVNSISKLTVHLANSSYYTNYTLIHMSDMCQQTVRINLQERALGYTNVSSVSKLNSSYLTFLIVFAFFLKIR